MLLLIKQILKAVVRIEKKLDEVLTLSLKAQTAPGMLPLQLNPLNRPGQNPCPLCQQPVKYYPMIIEDGTTEVIRECGCKPQTIELPAQQGDI